MKLQYLPNGSPDCPLIRLFEFARREAILLRQVFSHLATDQAVATHLHDMPSILPIDGCRLILEAKDTDAGILRNGEENSFRCVLTADSWSLLADLTEPFTKDTGGFQWLDRTSDISLLLSNSGTW